MAHAVAPVFPGDDNGSGASGGSLRGDWTRGCHHVTDTASGQAAPETRLGAPAVGRRPAWYIMLVVLLMAIVATLMAYEPWRRAPFDITDFSEFLPFLHRPSLGQQWDGFIQYYESQGRWSVLQYAATILKWNVFGTNVVAWQLSRFVEVWFVVVAAFWVLRRFGADRWGATAGAGLFLFAAPAVEPWVVLTMGEPLALCFLLPALYVASGYRATTHWRRDAVLIAACAAMALLAKEMVVGFVPFLLAIGCCLTGPGRLERPRNDARTRWLIGVVAVACLAVLVPVALVAHYAPKGSYASEYRWRGLDISTMVLHFGWIFLPVSWFGPPTAGLRIPGNVLFIGVLAWAAGLTWLKGRPAGVWPAPVVAWVVLALYLPAIVVAEYAPWHKWLYFYGLPNLFGTAMLLAGSVTVIDRRAPRAAPLAWAACAGAVFFAGLHAGRFAGETRARRDVYGAVAEYLAGHSRGATVIMRGALSPFPERRFADLGPTLGRYAIAVYPDSGLPPIRDTACQAPLNPAGDGPGGTVVLNDVFACGVRGHPSRSFQARYRALALSPPWLRTDTIRVDLCDRVCGP